MCPVPSEVLERAQNGFSLEVAEGPELNWRLGRTCTYGFDCFAVALCC
jgi:hypothetical protein